MIRIRIHGRAGMGVVSAAYLTASAAFKDGKQAQAFPKYGPERRGAPITSYVRIDKNPITIRSQIYNPDILIVLDESLFADAVKDLKTRTTVIINSRTCKLPKKHKVCCVDAKTIAKKVFGRPLYNTIMLGALIKYTKLITKKSLFKAIDQTWSKEIALKNKKAINMVLK